MTNKAIIQREPSKIEANKTLLELPNSELLTTLDRIRSLQTTLYRLASILNGDSIEGMVVTQLALRKLSNEIIQVLAFRYMQNNREAVQNWENEGGKIVYASV
mgnify:CR=1 FL=1